MTRATFARAGRAVAVAVAVAAALLVALVAGDRLFERESEPAATAAPAPPLPTAGAVGAAGVASASASDRGFLYGRITSIDGTSYEGRLRLGGGEEAFWSDTFHGFKAKNRWVAHVPPERLPRESRPIEIFGLTVAHREQPLALGRPFLARFGDIARIEARGSEVQVTMKSGTAFDLERFEASDFDDGVRVWDGRRGVVDLDSLRIRAIELLPTAALGAAPGRLHGTVRTRQGEFTGFVQWNRAEGVGSDELDGKSADGDLGLRFDTLRSIARRSRDSSLVTLLDGRELELSGTEEVGRGNRGIYVDDRRYGRVLVSWDAFERLDFSAGAPDGTADTGPAYGDFPPGRALRGSVTSRAGRTLAGRLVYDLDESETTETLDAEDRGVDFTIYFDLIATIAPHEPDAHGATVVLHAGETLELEGSADVDPRHGGLLIFPDGVERPEYVRWNEIGRIDFERPPTIDPEPR